jgi:hypothetical protein
MIIKVTIYDKNIIKKIEESGFFENIGLSKIDNCPMYTFSKLHDRLLKIDNIFNKGKKSEKINRIFFDLIQEIRSHIVVLDMFDEKN